MAAATMLEELLTMVGGDDDQRILESTVHVERIEQTPQLFVNVGDLAPVERFDVREVAI